MSYIVKNCPAILPMTKLCDSESIFNCGTYCKYCTDCVIKQVIEKCKKIAKDHYWGMREIRFSKEILQLFDIEEVK